MGKKASQHKIDSGAINFYCWRGISAKISSGQLLLEACVMACWTKCWTKAPCPSVILLLPPVSLFVDSIFHQSFFHKHTVIFYSCLADLFLAAFHKHPFIVCFQR